MYIHIKKFPPSVEALVEAHREKHLKVLEFLEPPFFNADFIFFK